jgi:hypothetical protein
VKLKTVCYSAIVFLVAASFAVVGDGVARVNTPPGVGVGLVIDGSASRVPGKLAFFEGDPIPIVLTLENVGGDLITSQGFNGKPFYRYLTFTDPAGKGILADDLESFTPTEVHVPPPMVLPVGLELLQVEAVEVLIGMSPGPPWSLSIGIPDAHTFYTLYRNVPYPAGRYSVKAIIPMRTYSRIDYPGELVGYSLLTSVAFQETVASDPVYFSIIADRDNDGFSYPEDPNGLPDCDDGNASVHPGATEIPGNGIDDDCNPATVDASPPQGTIALHAVKYLVGQGSHPPTLQEPLASMPVKIMSMSPGSCVAQHGFKWTNYDAIWGGVGSCPAEGSGSTDASGDLVVIMPPGEYAILGYTDPNPAVNNDELYISATVVLAADATQHVNVQAIVTPVGKFVPAQATRRNGSELWIIEPEYIEWTGTEEFYPFVFRSVGDWNVSTSITPPEGFVADADALEADVNSALTAVQFVVTDVGSEWKDTRVKHKVKHRGKTETIKTKIGVKNSQGKKVNPPKKKK